MCYRGVPIEVACSKLGNITVLSIQNLTPNAPSPPPNTTLGGGLPQYLTYNNHDAVPSYQNGEFIVGKQFIVKSRVTILLFK